MLKLFERIKLNWKFIAFSKRLAIITIIGLSISVAMITQNILFLNSFRTNAFDEFATNTTDTYIEVDMSHLGTIGFSTIQMVTNAVETGLEELDFNTNAYDQEWIFNKFVYLLLFNEMYHENEFHNLYVLGVNSGYLELLEPFLSYGRTPVMGEYVIITNTQTLEETNLDIDTEYEAYVPVDASKNPWTAYAMGIPDAGGQVEFSGIINIDDISFGNLTLSDERQMFISMIMSFNSEILITDVGTLYSLLIGITLAPNDLDLLGRILFNVETFDAFQIDEMITKLRIFVNNLQEELIIIVKAISPDYEIDIEAKIIPMLANFKTEFRIFQIFLLVFMLPTLGMALVLTAFASNQIRKQRDRQIHNFHQRGASRGMLFLFMLFELLIYALIAVLIGFLIGWPYTFVALKSDGFFAFGAPIEAMNFSFNIIASCLGLGFGVAFFSNVFSLWKRTKSTVEDALQERNEKKPFWERFYIDVFFLILGLIMWFSSNKMIGGAGAISLEFAFYFATPAPILLIIGSIMFATRIYGPVINFVSTILFKIPKFEISAISARNAIRRKSSTNRTILLMTLTFALTIASMIVPDSYRAYDLEDAYYTLGADIVVNDVDILSSNYKKLLRDIEGVEEASYVGILELTNSESDLLYQIKILGIELDNFTKIAYEEKEYTNSRTMGEVLKSINNCTEVIGQINQMDLLNLDKNNTFVIKNYGLEGMNVVEKLFPVNFVDSFQYWPTLYYFPPIPTSNEVFIAMIANISLPYIIARNEFDVQGKAIVKVEEGYNIKEVAESIEEITRHEVYNVEELLLISEGSLKSTVLFGALNSSFIISLIISSATLIMMMVIQAIEREKEIAVMKSMGISTAQLFNFFISEAILILSFTLIIGMALGFGSSVMIMRILRISSIFPPHENVFPMIKVLWTAAAIFVSGLVSTIIPILINTKKKIGGALKSL